MPAFIGGCAIWNASGIHLESIWMFSRFRRRGAFDGGAFGVDRRVVFGTRAGGRFLARWRITGP